MSSVSTDGVAVICDDGLYIVAITPLLMCACIAFDVHRMWSVSARVSRTLLFRSVYTKTVHVTLRNVLVNSGTNRSPILRAFTYRTTALTRLLPLRPGRVAPYDGRWPMTSKTRRSCDHESSQLNKLRVRLFSVRHLSMRVITNEIFWKLFVSSSVVFFRARSFVRPSAAMT